MIFENTMSPILFRQYLETKGLADSTIYNYTKAIEHFLKDSPNVNDLHSYNSFLIKVMAKPNKRATFYYAAIKHFINFNCNQQVAKKISSGLIRPQERDPKISRQYLDKEKRTEILNYLFGLNEKHFIIALIQMQTGVRIGDILRLELGNINWEKYKNKQILRFDIIGKRQKRKTTYITNYDMAKIVWDWIEVNDLNIKDEEFDLFDKTKEIHYFLDPIVRKAMHTLFHRIQNTARSYRMNLKIALKNCNLDSTRFSTHDWRRCFSRDNYTEFNDIVLLQNVLGHSTIATTSRYLRHSGLNTLSVLEKMQN